MKDYMSPDTPNRDRTFADRKAFVLAEQTLETAKALAEANAPKGPEPLATDAIVGNTDSAKRVDRIVRRFEVNGDELTYGMEMAAVDQPLTLHLRATLRRV